MRFAPNLQLLKISHAEEYQFSNRSLGLYRSAERGILITMPTRKALIVERVIDTL